MTHLHLQQHNAQPYGHPGYWVAPNYGEHYMEEAKNQMLMRTCPVHGEGTAYKEQLA